MTRVPRCLSTTILPATVLILCLGLSACGSPPADEEPGAESSEAQGQASGEAAPRAIPAHVVVNLLRCERDGDSLRTIGSARNQGQEDVRYVDVSLSWADSTGALVATDVASIVQGETLMAGDSVVFSVATAHPQAAECSEASLFVYEPIP